MAESLIKYINYIETIYQDKFVEIFSLSLESIYRSVKMNKMYEGLKLINNKDYLEPSKILLDFDQINQSVVEKKSPVKFLCISSLNNDEILLGHGVRQPIILEGKIVGIFSMITPAKIFSFDFSLKNYVSHVPHTKLECKHNLTDIEEQILFLSSYGFTQGEIYEILKLDKNMSIHINSIDNVKYYYFAILKKFGLDSLDLVIESIASLKSRQFIPKSLFKTNKVITVN